MTVARLLEEMTSDELTYWMAYSEIEKEEAEHQKNKEQVKNTVRRRR